MRIMKKRYRRNKSCGKLELEKIIGLTTTNASGFAYNFSTGDCVYLAGCVVVVHNINTNSQVRFLMTSRTPKALTCVAYSHYGGKFIAAGESGYQPAVIIWDSSTGSCIADLKAHKYGVSCVEFSPNGRHLLSVGFPHDGFLCLWDWKIETLVSKIRATTSVSPINAVHFSSDGNFFLTAGAKHLKHWIVGVHAGCRVTAGLGTLATDCKPVNLGSKKESSFISVSSASYFTCVSVTADQCVETLQPIYALTTAGILCLLHSGVAIKKWVDLKVRQGYGLSVSDSHVACACSNGVVRLFVQETLLYAGTLPKPAPYGYHGLNDEKVCANFSLPHDVSGLNFPDAIACSFSGSQKLAVIYRDHNLYVWDVHNLSKITRWYALLSHSACIWDISNIPSSQTLGTGSINCLHSAGAGPARGAFVTCSADNTIRLWDLALASDTKESDSEAAVLHSKPANAFCKHLLGVIYSDISREISQKQIESEELVDVAQGFRSLAVSADGLYLAAGDRSGNLFVYNLSTFDLLSFQEAHDAEILSLTFSNANEKKTVGNGCKDHCFLASGGRDRLIHIYDVNRGFDVIETLDDHSASITSVKFACNGSKLLSCSADKSVVFRNIVATESGCKSTCYHQEVASHGTVYDMDIEPESKFVLTVGQDKKIKVISLTTGKPVRTFKQGGGSGEPIKVCVDQSGSYIICSHADKCMRIYDFTTGDLVAQASGHAEVITGAIFLADCKHVISVSGDSCIFVWKLPALLSKTMQKRVVMNVGSFAYSNLSPKESQPKDALGQDGLCCQLNGEIPDEAKFCCQQRQDLQDQAKYEYIDTNTNANSGVWCTPRDAGSLEPSAFKFSISRLPKWARTKLMDDNLTATRNNKENMDTNIFFPRQSRWAERLGPDGYRLFTENEEYKTPPATIRPYNCGHRRCFATEEQPTFFEKTPESSFSSHNDKSSASSKVQQSVNKDTHWRTVHTVFYDEIDILQEKCSECNGPSLSAANFEKFEERAHLNVNSYPQAVSSIADILTSEMQETISMGNIVNIDIGTDDIKKINGDMYCDVPDNDVDMTHTYRTPQPMCSILNGEVDCNIFLKMGCNNNSYLHTCKVPESNFLGSLEPHYDKILSEASSVEDESEDELCCETDLFSTHFGSLSTAFKLKIGTTSARSSFSTRFFAHSSCSMAQMTLFQVSPRENSGSLTDGSETLSDQDLSIDDGSLIARERKHLKQLELQRKVVQEGPTTGDNSTSLMLPTSEGSTEVEDRANSNGGLYDGRVCGYEILEPVHINDNLSNKFDNSLLCSLHSCVDVEGLLVNFDVKSKDNTQVILEKQEGEMATRQESEIEQELLGPSISLSLEREEDIGGNCPSSSCARLILNDQPAEINISHKKSEESNPNHIPMELQQCSSQSYKSSTVDIGDSVENDGRENGCSEYQPDKSGKKGKEIVTQSPMSLQEYKEALINLSDAAQKALNLFSELRGQNTFDAESIHLQYNTGFLDFAHGIIQTTMENVHRLRDLALPDQLYKSRQNTLYGSMDTEVGEKPTFNVCNFCHETVRSRECQPLLVKPSEKILDSVEIEALVERYSERLSHSLSSQVLALIQKGLSSQNET